MKQINEIHTRKNFFVSVRLFRIIAMFSILICHIGTAINIPIISQTFNVGVYFFLFISGYLYSKKEIYNKKKWLMDRYLKISIPVIIYVCFCLIINLVANLEFSYLSIPFYIINLQGIFKLIEFIPSISLINGTEHLWFITALFICYLLMIVFKDIENKSKKKFSIIIIFLFIFTPILTYFGLRLDFVMIYFIGYIYKQREVKANLKNIFICGCLTFIAIVFRLYMRNYCDINGDIPLHLNIAIPLFNITTTVFSFILFDYICNKLSRFHLFMKFCLSKPLQLIDTLSLYIYIGHYILLVNKFSVFNIVDNRLLQISIFLFLSFVIGFAILFFEIIVKKFFKYMQRLENEKK